MIPRLYARNETDFTHNGIGLLSDSISATVTEELNSTCELQLEYDVDGQFADQIDDGMIIKAKANDKQDDQLFRIYKHVKDQADNKITVYAQHITYDLAQNFVEALELDGATTAQAMQAIQSNLAYLTRFTLLSDNTTTTSSTKLYRNNPLQMIAGVDGSILDNWGGEIERNNFNLIMRARRGTDDGVLVAYRKNLTGLTVTVDRSNLVTRIYPFKMLDDGTVLTIPGKYVDSPHINDYDHIYIQAVDYSSDADVTDQASLEAKSAQWFTLNSGIDMPAITMEVAFEPLWATEEYKMVKMLELVGMGDTIYIKNSYLGIDGSARIIKIVYDVLAEKNTQVTAGDAKTSLEDKVNAISTVNTKADAALTLAGYAIANADGTTTIYSATEPVGNYKVGSLWFKLVDGTYSQMYRYNGISWDKILSADANDALNKAIDALTAANGKNTVYHQAAQPIAGKNGDIWFRENADGTITQFIYQSGQWVNPVQDSIKVAQDQAVNAVNTAESAITQAQAAINTANSAFSTATSASNTANSALSQAQSAISTAQSAQSAANSAQQSISSKVWMSDVNGAVAAVQVGGTNLVTNSSYNLGSWGSQGSVVDGYMGNKAVEIKRANYSGSTRLSVAQDVSLPIYSNGTQYALSAWVYVYSDIPLSAEFNNVYLRCYNTSGGIISDIAILSIPSNTITETWLYLKSTGSLPSGTTRVTVQISLDRNGHFITSMLKLELGNKSTDWSPAPADMATAVQFSQLNQTVNGISTQVSNKVDTTTYNAYTAQTADTIATLLTKTDAAGTYATQSALAQTSSSFTSQITTVQNNLNNVINAGNNLVQDSGFESSKWSGTTTEQHHLGSKALKVTANGGIQDIALASIKTSPGRVYYFEAWVLAGQTTWSGTVQIAMSYNQSNGSNHQWPNVSALPANGGQIWTKLSGYTTVSDGYDSALFRISVRNDVAAGAIFYFDDAIVVDVTDSQKVNASTQSQITQISTDINLRVQKNDVINQINISTESVLIAGTKVHITGQTMIDNAVITSAMISALDAGKITTGTLNAARIGASTITSDKLNVANLAAISANLGNITAGSLNAVSINGASIFGTTITGSQINGESITSGIISADRIAANSITSDKIKIGDFNNLIENPDFDHDAPGNFTSYGWSGLWVASNPWTGSEPNGYSNPSKLVAQIGAQTSGNADRWTGKLIPVSRSDEFFTSADVKWNGVANGAVVILAHAYDANGNGLSSWIQGAKSYHNTYWHHVEGTIKVSDMPIETAYVMFGVSWQGSNSDTGDVIWVDNIMVRRKQKGELIVDGTIQGVNIIGSSFYQNANGFETWIDFNGFHQTNGAGREVWIRGGGLESIGGKITAYGSSQGGSNGSDVVYIGQSNADPPIRIYGNSNSAETKLFGGVVQYRNNQDGAVTNASANWIHMSYSNTSADWFSSGFYLNTDGSQKVGLNSNGDCWANHWYTWSTEDRKQDITELPEGQALAVINALDIRAYQYKDEATQGKDKVNYGPIIGDSYNTPEQFLSADGRGTDDHSALYLAIKSIQELTTFHQQDVLKIAELESRISLLEGAAA